MRGVIAEEVSELYGSNGRAYSNTARMIDREGTGAGLRMLMVALGISWDRVGELWDNHERARAMMSGGTRNGIARTAAYLIYAIQNGEIRDIRAYADALQRAIIAYGGNIPGLNAHPRLMSRMSGAGMLSQSLIIQAQIFAGATGRFEIATELFLMIDPDTDIAQYNMAALEWLLMYGKLPPLRHAGEPPQEPEED
jgi:hypothetical protein